MSFSDSGWKKYILFGLNGTKATGLSPAAPGTVVPSATNLNEGGGLLIGISQESVAVIDALIVAPAVGTLDVVVQSSVDADQAGNGNWYDILRFPQALAAAAAIRYVATLSRGFNKVVAAPSLTGDSSGGTLTLAVNTVIPDALGIALRVVLVAGVGTSVGAVQRITVGLSK
jgi:hypothetical protein